MKPLVSTEDLALHPQWRVIDCRHDLGDPLKGRLSYEAGHIPGAIHAHLDHDLSAARSGTNGRHPLPTAAQFARWLGDRGVRNSDVLVAYDDDSGAFAARFWWMCRWIGKAEVAVLDGGFAAWVREGRPVETEQPTYDLTKFQFTERSGVSVNSAQVLSNLRTHEFLVLDARGANRFAGRDETIDPVAGHIPNAENRPFANNLAADGRFKPAGVLRSEFGALLSGRNAASVVHQCGSGVTACHNALAMELADLPGSRIYPGSWSEWIADPSRPIISGA